MPKWKRKFRKPQQVIRDKDELEKELEEPVELDELELEKYVEFVVREVRKGNKQ